MTIKVKEGGAWADVSTVHDKSSGAWNDEKSAWTKEGGTWKKVYTYEESYTLTSQNDLNLETYLSGHGATATKPQRIIVPNGVTIGSTDVSNAAIVSGDLSAYTAGVTLEVQAGGVVMGKGGAGGSGTSNGTNATGGSGGAGGDAISATTALTVENEGTIAGGGGGSGGGGSGGDGDSFGSFTAEQYSTDTPRYYWHTTGDLEIFWNSVDYGPTSGYYRVTGGYCYARGANVTGSYYKVKRATYYAGTQGGGGAGGDGAGSQNSGVAGSGNAGNSGTYRAGNGGTGQVGGSLGSNGSNGGTGGTGTYISTTSLYATRSGYSGGVAGAAGMGYSSSGNIAYSGGGTVYGATS